MPLDVRKYILKIQGETKAQKGVSQYSLQLTIYQIIRDHKKYLTDEKIQPGI